MTTITTTDGPVEIDHDSVERCQCGASLRESEDGIAYERNAYGTWERHTCPEGRF